MPIITAVGNPVRHDITVYRGTWFQEDFQLYDEDGVIIQLDGWLARATLKRNRSDTDPEIAFSTIVDPPSDTATVAFTAYQTAALTADVYMYDVLLIPPSASPASDPDLNGYDEGEAEHVAEGLFFVRGSVTSP